MRQETPKKSSNFARLRSCDDKPSLPANKIASSLKIGIVEMKSTVVIPVKPACGRLPTRAWRVMEPRCSEQATADALYRKEVFLTSEESSKNVLFVPRKTQP